MTFLQLGVLGVVLLARPMLGQGSSRQAEAHRPLLDKQAQLNAQTFWDNRDWDWYKASIPFFECPDRGLVTTYYYRWELLTKHLIYGSPSSGYSFTEFIDRPFWSGAYGAISCPAGHQMYEARWLRSPRVVRDYARYWFRTPGAEPRRYSTWLADAAWAAHQVHPDEVFIRDLLPDLVRNFEGWEREHFVPEAGLFWQTGHDDGMEYNINSRQTRDIVRGAPGFRPTLNAYLWADALAIARAADLAGNHDLARAYREKADGLKRNLQEQLWDPNRSFFFHKFRDDEEKDGFVVKAGSLTYQSGRFAGCNEGRELIGYVPWQFGLPDRDKGYEEAWKFLMNPAYFKAPFGPTVTGRNDPLFLVTDSCCWWSGQSWPYATSQTLKAMANLLQEYPQAVVSRDDYLELLLTYSATHRKEGKPYLAEAANPDTGSFQGYDSYNHSEHYFHSGFVDLVITGLVGIVPRDDEVLELVPLAPEEWDYFCLDDVVYRGRRLTIAWDRTGNRYGLGAGLRVLADGKEIARGAGLDRLEVALPPAPAVEAKVWPVNFAVNNEGLYYPRVSVSSTGEGTSAGKLIDGNYWYHVHPPNRWTSGPAEAEEVKEELIVDLGTARRLEAVKLYFLDDEGETDIAPPARYEVEAWEGDSWVALPRAQKWPRDPQGRRANVVGFPEREVSRLRVGLTRRPGKRVGLSEVEAWGPGDQSIEPAPMPAGNLAYNPGDRPYPKASASFTSRFDAVERANDGRVNFLPNPNNRWTSYESPNEEDWLAIDFGALRRVGRVELALYDDRGGVRAPEEYRVETWEGERWVEVARPRRLPEKPVGGQFNEVRFEPVETQRVRIVFRHREASRTGVSEVLIWPE